MRNVDAHGVKILPSPGRFFAANELKTMMAYLVMNYDIKMKTPGVRPPNLEFALAVVPNPFAKVLFRRRKSKS